eukprot:SAG31_NODE_10642_length_1114_cov_1.431527_1_plen_62_part_10
MANTILAACSQAKKWIRMNVSHSQQSHAALGGTHYATSCSRKGTQPGRRKESSTHDAVQRLW